MYFASKFLISPNQHGFVSNRSTVSNLAVFSEYCISSFSEGFQVDCVYTDFSKAFDKVSHSLLIYKLSCMGFHSVFLNWIKSYLYKRNCVVTIDGISSEPFFASSGVPQGSILGPLLFVLFINDISSCFRFANFLIYADDLKVYSKISNQDDALELQNDIDALELWCVSSQLSLNIKKCFKVTYSKTHNILPTSYKISHYLLESLNEVKDLGVIFSSNFSFKSHISHIISKAYSVLGFVRRNSSKFTDPYTLKLLYTSFVRSNLEYAAFIWRPSHKIYINRIERVQKIFLKYALRSLSFVEPIPTYQSRLLLINLKSLEVRRSVLSLSFVFNIISGSIDCSFLLERINFNIPQCNLRSFLPFYGAKCKTEYSRNAPLVRALNELNSIADSIQLDFSSSKSLFLISLYSIF